MTITVYADVYHGLHLLIGRRRISRFLNDLARPHVIGQDLSSGYAAMAADTAREIEAQAWSEEWVTDVADAAGRDIEQRYRQRSAKSDPSGASIQPVRSCLPG